MKFLPIDIELMRSLLEYKPEVGGSCLVWKVDMNRNKAKAGDIAGCNSPSGYWNIRVQGKYYQAHRLVWAIVTGEDPPYQIDHILGCEKGNNIENLRLSPQGQRDNNQNTARYKNNTSGYTGVSFHKRTGKWIGTIHYNNKRRYLGLFDTPMEAHEAYSQAKAELHTFNPTSRG